MKKRFFKDFGMLISLLKACELDHCVHSFILHQNGDYFIESLYVCRAIVFILLCFIRRVLYTSLFVVFAVIIISNAAINSDPAINHASKSHLSHPSKKCY